MTEVLSQDEIDQWLSVISAGDCDGIIPPNNRKNIAIYDFKYPSICTKKELQKISKLFERVSVYLQEQYVGSSISVSSVGELNYKNFIYSIPKEPCIHKLDHDHLKMGILEIDSNLKSITTGAITNHIESAVGKFTNNNDYHLDYKLYDNMSEMGVLITFEVVLSESEEGMFNLWFPAKEFKAWLHRGDKKEKNNMKFHTGDIKTTVNVSLGKAARCVNEVENMEEGTIIELDRTVGDLVPVFVDGQQIGAGEVIIIDESFGVRLVEVYK